jgi:hypothetical protein
MSAMKLEEQRAEWLKQLDLPLTEYEKLAARDREYYDAFQAAKPPKLGQMSAQGRASAIERAQEQVKQAGHIICSHAEWYQVLMLAASVIQRTAPGTTHDRQSRELLSKSDRGASSTAGLLIGIVRALRLEVEAGYLKSLGELVHGELFSDFLDMAQHLFDETYVDAAAVIAGGSLEEHLRQMCKKEDISLEYTDGKGKLRRRMMDDMNNHLAKANAYSAARKGIVNSWIGLRNAAAHAQYMTYTKEEIQLMITGIRDFVASHPA